MVRCRRQTYVRILDHHKASTYNQRQATTYKKKYSLHISPWSKNHCCWTARIQGENGSVKKGENSWSMKNELQSQRINGSDTHLNQLQSQQQSLLPCIMNLRILSFGCSNTLQGGTGGSTAGGVTYAWLGGPCAWSHGRA